MGLKKKITVSWSGGKDSAYALYKVLQSDEYEIVHLHTIINEKTKRIGMHGVRESLVTRQAELSGFKLIKLYLKGSEDHEAYKELLRNFYSHCKDEGIEAVLFGDIFLEDLRAFRDSELAVAGLYGIYPLWKLQTKKLVEEFLQDGFKTLICAANEKYFTKEDLGVVMDPSFVNKLSPSVDPCGENGEFHTFVFDGPIFNKPLRVQATDVIRKSYQYFVQDQNNQPAVHHAHFLFSEILEKT